MTVDAMEQLTLSARHASHLRQFIGAPASTEIAPTGSKEIMLAALRAAEIDLLATFACVPTDEQLSRPVCGIWTLHDIVGHLADWDAYFINWLGILRGNAPKEMVWDEDGDALNEWLRVRRQGEAWAVTWATFRRNRADFVAQLEQVDAEEFMRVQPSRKDVSYSTIYHCSWSALEHFLDHAAGVRRELALPLPPELLTFSGPYT